MTDSVFARQPIFDRDLRLVAHELLFRGGFAEGPSADRGDRATWQVLGEVRAGSHSYQASALPVYINFTRNWLLSNASLPAPHVVIEVLEDLPVDGPLLARLA